MTAITNTAKNWLAPDAPVVAGMVSVIIPNYNHAAYLPDAIDSLLRQQYTHHEIIVVDDGSTDNSRDVAARYEGQIRYIWQQNAGLSAARNTGLRAARGEYIALLDADDILEPNFMQVLVAHLAANPAVDGVICGYRFVDEQNNDLPQQEARTLPPGDLFTTLLDGNFLVPESILVRRHCYVAAGPFDETLRACEDWDMWLRMSRDFAIATLPQLLTRHRVLAGSMSSNPQRMLTNRLVVLGRFFSGEPQSPTDGSELQRRAYGRAYLTSAADYLQVRDTENAFVCLQKLANIMPSLLVELDTLYELALGDQPKGRRGEFASLNLAWSWQALAPLLTRLGSETAVAPLHAQMMAQAHLAFGLLHYGARQMAAARRHMRQAVAKQPQLMWQRPLWATYLKSWLPRS